MGYRKFACGHEPTGCVACPTCGSADLVEHCTCGSGAHPRRCALHVGAYEAHLADLASDSDWPDAPCRQTSPQRCSASGRWWPWLACESWPRLVRGGSFYASRGYTERPRATCWGFRTWWGALCTHDPGTDAVYDAYLRGDAT